MSSRITRSWICAHKEQLVSLGIANGVGSQSHWSTKPYKWVLRNVLDSEKSFFYEASIYHDTLYFVGNTDSDRVKADFVFLLEMVKLIIPKCNKWRIDKIVASFAVAVTYFSIVRFFGKSSFNSGDRVTKKQLLEMMDKKRRSVQLEEYRMRYNK